MTEYVEVADCGHIPMDEYPQEFVAALLPFVEKVLGRMSPGSSSDPGSGNGEGSSLSHPTGELQGEVRTAGTDTVAEA